MTLVNATPSSPTGTSVGLSAPDDERTRTIADLVEDAGHLKNRTQLLVDDTTELHEETLDQLLLQSTSERVREPMQSLLGVLSDLGFSWTDIARVVGVSIPALRKWRTGEGATVENLRRVAELTAFCDIVNEHYMISEPATWLEVPLVPHVTLSGLDLLAESRFDLLFRWASDLRVDPEDILTEFEPNWRDEADTAVEVFTAGDGKPGLRLRED